jgi:hypothetical protein
VKNLLTRTLALAALLSPAFAFADAAPERQYAVYAHGQKGATGEVLLNGVPLLTLTGETSFQQSGDAQLWLRAGDNRLEIVLTHVDSAAPALSAEVDVVIPSASAVPKPLATLILPKAALSAHLTFKLSDPSAAALVWSKAQVISSLTDADRRELHDLAAALYKAIRAHDAATLEKLCGFQLDELGRLFHRPNLRQGFLGSLASEEVQTAWADTTLAPAFVYRLVGDGRAVFVTDAQGHDPLVITKPHDIKPRLTVHAARIDGHFTLLP